MFNIYEVDLETILQLGLSESPDCFAVIAHDRRILYANDTFSELFQQYRQDFKESYILGRALKSKQGIILEQGEKRIWFENTDAIKSSQNIDQQNLDDCKVFKMVQLGLSNGYILICGIYAGMYRDNACDQSDTLTTPNHTDKLTGLNNRASFEVLAKTEIVSAKNEHYPLSLLLLDIDNFKQANIDHNRDVGDQVLKEFSQIITQLLRQSDNFFRLGGEEFAIMLPRANRTDAYNIAERIRHQVSEYLFTEHKINITVSIGLSYLISTDHDINEILVRADTALFQARETGQNRVVEYSFYTD